MQQNYHLLYFWIGKMSASHVHPEKKLYLDTCQHPLSRIRPVDIFLAIFRIPALLVGMDHTFCGGNMFVLIVFHWIWKFNDIWINFLCNIPSGRKIYNHQTSTSCLKFLLEMSFVFNCTDTHDEILLISYRKMAKKLMELLFILNSVAQVTCSEWNL